MALTINRDPAETPVESVASAFAGAESFDLAALIWPWSPAILYSPTVSQLNSSRQTSLPATMPRGNTGCVPSSSLRRIGWGLLAVCCAGLVSGCSLLSGTANDWGSETSQLATDMSQGNTPATPIAPAAKCVLEVKLVSVDAEKWDAEAAERLWSHADETIVAPEVRGNWTGNGMRVGEVSSESGLQEVIQPLTEHHNVLDDFFHTTGVDAAQLATAKPIVMDTGRRYEYPLGQPRPGQQVFLFRDMSGPVRGQTFSGAQSVLTLRADDRDEYGSVIVRIAPEIQHGGMQQRVVSSDTGMRIDHSRQRWPLDSLAFPWKASVGQTLMIASIPQANSPVAIDQSVRLGDRMLGRIDAQNRAQVWIMLIKVRQVPS